MGINYRRALTSLWKRLERNFAQAFCPKSLTSFLAFTLVLAIFIYGCTFPGKRREVPQIQMLVNNPLPVERTDEFVVLPVADLKDMAPDFSPEAFVVMDTASNQEIPYQLDDIDNDGEGDEIAMVLNMGPGEQKGIVIRYAPEGPESRSVKLGYKKRTRAAIHPEYEGIGWESELIAYRVYPDYRNSISVFGKQEPGLSLDKFAASTKSRGYDYLETWGVNVLDGGKSVGCGGFGLWYENRLLKPLNISGDSSPKPDDMIARYTRVVADGPIRSVAQVIFDKWRVGDKTLRVTATYSIFAGQRWTRNQIRIEGADSPTKVAAGLMKSEAANLTRDEKNGFFYTWGSQSHRDTPDDLGIALIYPTENLDSFHEDDITDSYLAALNPGADNEIVYWSLAAWSSGELGVRKDTEFADLVLSVAQKVKHPLTVTIMQTKQQPAKEPPR
jgi:hypothetical protein